MDFLILAALLAALTYWWDTSRCNELALQHCRELCERNQVQLLDSTIVRQRLWLRRTGSGGLQLCRLYSFEFSGDSETRHYGYIVMLGHTVAESHMQPWRTLH